MCIRTNCTFTLLWNTYIYCMWLSVSPASCNICDDQSSWNRLQEAALMSTWVKCVSGLCLWKVTLGARRMMRGCGLDYWGCWLKVQSTWCCVIQRWLLTEQQWQRFCTQHCTAGTCQTPGVAVQPSHKAESNANLTSAQKLRHCRHSCRHSKLSALFRSMYCVW